MPYALVVCAAALVILWLAGAPWLAHRARRRVRAQPFPAAWREVMERRVPYVRRLPARLRAQLEDHMKVFLAGKQFFGCGGMQVDDEVRVTIAAQACLLVLERGGECFPKLGQ